MKFQFQQIVKGRKYSKNIKARRRGVAFIYLAISMLALLGVTGLVIDIGHLHMKEAQAGRAADAAALAGAMQMPDEAAALAAAREYAQKNNYFNGRGGTVVTGTVDSADPSRYTVHIERPEPLFFIRVLGNGSTQQVGATETAQYTSAVPVDMKLGSGVYGALGPINLSVYGPIAIRKRRSL